MLTSIAQHVVVGWLWRRLQEVVAWAFGLIPLYLSLPPEHQETIREILTGKGGGLSVSAAIGLAYFLFTQWQSYRATTQVQAVTSDGQKVVPKKDSAVAQQIDEVAVGVKPQSLKPTIFEQLLGVFKRT